MDNYNNLLNNLSPELQKIKRTLLETIRITMFGGDDDEYGQNVFKDKYLKNLETARPHSPVESDKIISQIKQILEQSNHHNKADLILLNSLSNSFATDIKKRSSDIQCFNTFFNDYLNFDHGFFPVREMIELIRDANQTLISLILNLDDEAIVLVKIEPDKLWNHLKSNYREIEEYYFLLNFLEIYYHAIFSKNIVNKDIIEAMWTVLNIILNNSKIVYLYIESRPITFDKTIDERITSDRTTRIKIFYTTTDSKIYQIRIDLPHQEVRITCI